MLLPHSWSLPTLIPSGAAPQGPCTTIPPAADVRTRAPLPVPHPHPYPPSTMAPWPPHIACRAAGSPPPRTGSRPSRGTRRPPRRAAGSSRPPPDATRRPLRHVPAAHPMPGEAPRAPGGGRYVRPGRRWRRGSRRLGRKSGGWHGKGRQGPGTGPGVQKRELRQVLTSTSLRVTAIGFSVCKQVPCRG